MGTARFASARVRGLALVALVAVPLLVFTTYSYIRERDAARENAQARVLNIAILAQHDYQLRIDAAEQLVTPGFPFASGASLARVTDRAGCDAAMGALLGRLSGYVSLFEADLTGVAFCSAAGPNSNVNIADRDYFRQAVSTGKPAVGDPTIGRVTNKPSVIVGYPILDESGKPVAVAAAGLDLSTIVVLPTALELPPGSSVTLLDRSGIVMARNIDSEKWIGKPGPSLVGLPGSVADGANHTTFGTGVDGVAWLYGVVPLQLRPDSPVQGTLLVGIPALTAYAPADAVFRKNLSWLAVVCALAMLVAWLGTERLVLAPLQAITVAMQRIAGGAFETRTGLAEAGGEIGMIAAAVDAMAAQLATTQAELNDDRLEMAAILFSAPSVIASVSEDGIVTRINPAIERLFGWPAEEFVGHDVNELFERPVLPALVDGQGARLFDILGRHRDGSTLPLEVEIRELESGYGRRYIFVLRDLSERRRMEADREAARIAGARAEFLRTLSHELRSPLTAVLGFAQLLQSGQITAKARRQAEDIEGAGRHMLVLVDDLLDVARIDAGRWEVNLGEVNVGDMLGGVIAGLRVQATARGLSIDESTVPSPLIVETDPRILREVATNLIENAIKYTERGAVTVRARLDADLLVLEVADTGIGIAPDCLEAIFDEFERVRPAGGQPGSGLGLTITRKLTVMLGGTIGVESTPGVGSTFTVRLPVAVRSAV